MHDEITFHDCWRIFLDDWGCCQASTVPVLRDYKRHVLALLNDEFGIGWHDEWSDDARDKRLPALLSTMLREYARIVSPFVGWNEHCMLTS